MEDFNDRDEKVHCEFQIKIYEFLREKKEVSKEELKRIFDEAANIEKEFIINSDKENKIDLEKYDNIVNKLKQDLNLL